MSELNPELDQDEIEKALHDFNHKYRFLQREMAKKEGVRMSVDSIAQFLRLAADYDANPLPFEHNRSEY